MFSGKSHHYCLQYDEPLNFYCSRMLLIQHNYGETYRLHSIKPCFVAMSKWKAQIRAYFWHHPILIQISSNECKNLFQIQKQPPELFYEKGVLKIPQNLTEKHLCQSLFFNKVADLRHSLNNSNLEMSHCGKVSGMIEPLSCKWSELTS